MRQRVAWGACLPTPKLRACFWRGEQVTSCACHFGKPGKRRSKARLPSSAQRIILYPRRWRDVAPFLSEDLSGALLYLLLYVDGSLLAWCLYRSESGAFHTEPFVIYFLCCRVGCEIFRREHRLHPSLKGARYVY